MAAAFVLTSVRRAEADVKLSIIAELKKSARVKARVRRDIVDQDLLAATNDGVAQCERVASANRRA